MNKIIKLIDIRVDYGKAEALKGISLDVTEKSIVTLLGANGAGKSTTLRAIAGLINVKKGEIWFNEQKINSIAPHERVKMGIAHVLEGRKLFPYITVLGNLQIGAYSRRDSGLIKRDLEKVLCYFPRLKARLKQKAGTLSGGEQQMVAMGRGLMAAPKLMLLDEPTLGLSPLLVKEVARIIRQLNTDEMVSILLVEQNARMALSLATKGYVLETGCIVIADDSSKLTNNEHVKKAYLGG
jgi:branched-chain amino acid transport system ATP-binding protein